MRIYSVSEVVAKTAGTVHAIHTSKRHFVELEQD